MADEGSANLEDAIENEYIEDHFAKEVLNLRHSHAYDDIAAILLRENLVLTALELHTELMENGQELPRLRDFFSNPGNFEKQTRDSENSPGLPRTSSVQTFDSLDFARYSDDGEKQIDERVAVLEFELRKAKETIKSLRANLTFATESDVNVSDTKTTRITVDDAVKPHEKRALNFLVNEYLLKQNYKLTSITFSDENEDQDFEDWDDVGLNVPKPPNLLMMYRDFARHLYPKLNCESVGLQVNLTEDEIRHHVKIRKKLESEVTVLEKEIENLSKTNAALTLQINSFQEKSERYDIPQTIPSVDSINFFGDGNSSEVKDTLALVHSSTEEIKDETNMLINSLSTTESMFTSAANPARKLTSEEFHKTLLDLSCLRTNMQDNRLANEVADIALASDKIVLMLGRCLPHIVPNVILAKREELIPVILCTICLHPNTKDRDKLLNILFNLIKRPDDDQRQMILTGFVTLAQQLGPSKVQEELLPQCWEQISHKYTERRLLVAESSGVLAPYLPCELCSSLLLSMLQEMSGDKSELVREAVVKNLSLVIPYITDSDKFTQGYRVLVIALEDNADNVVSAAIQVLLPALASWALELDKLESELCIPIINMFEEKAKALKTISSSLVPSNEEVAALTLIFVLKSLISWIFLSVVRAGSFNTQNSEPEAANMELENRRFPIWKSPLEDIFIIIGDREEATQLISKYDKYIEAEWYETWPKFEWLTKTFLPKLLSCVKLVPVMCSQSVHEISSFFYDFSVMFGSKYVTTRIKPLFQSLLTANSQMDETSLTTCLVPVYVNGVLKIFFKDENRKELSIFIQDLLNTTAMCQLPLESVCATIMELSSDCSLHDLIIDILWDSVVHSSSAVRISTAQLIELLVRNVNETLLANRLVPALVTLANDSDIQVRIATLPAFGAVLEVTAQKELMDKVRMQFASFLDDPFYQEEERVLVELIRTFGQVAPNADSRFREEFVLPRLSNIASQNSQVSSESKKLAIAVALVDAYTSLSCCFLSDQQITEYLLPGLRFLLVDLQQIAPNQAETVSAMINELSAKVDVPRSSTTFLNAAGMTPSSMEDMKNKMSKIFSGATTQGRANISNIFQSRKK